MKIRCESCGKRYDIQKEEVCPFCGAFSSSSQSNTLRLAEEKNKQPQPQLTRSRPAEQQSRETSYSSSKEELSLSARVVSFLLDRFQTRKRSVVFYLITIFSATLISILSAVNNYNDQKDIRPEPERHSASDTVTIQMSIQELYRELERNPEHYQTALSLMELLLLEGQVEEAGEALLYLYRGSCTEAPFFRLAGELLEEGGNREYAVRAYLSAYSLSGDAEDARMAQQCGTPAQMFTQGPTTQALEFFFDKPLSRIDWSEVGQIRYIHLGKDDTVGFSLSDPAQIGDPLRMEETIQRFSIDDGVVSLSFLYGLREADLQQRINWSGIQPCAMRELHTLRMINVRGLEDLTSLSCLPSLETLYVGSGELVSLSGLEQLPNLTALGLEGTELQNLSNLAARENIKSLTLRNNKGLRSLASLEQMSQLEELHIHRQEMMDFSFVKGYSHLEKLTLERTGVKDVSFLEDLTSLTGLTLVDNSDLIQADSVEALSGLVELELDCSKLGRLPSLAGMSNLASLTLYSPESLNMVTGLSSLERIHIHNPGRLNSIGPVSGLPKLASFSMSAVGIGTPTFSLAPLASLPSLTSLSLPNIEFYGDLSPIFSIPTLEYLDLSSSGGEVGAGGFSGLSNLRWLRLSGFKARTNIRVYSDGFFTSIDYDDVELDRLTASLTGLWKLERLELSGVQLTDLSFAARLPRLEYLDLSHNYITDIQALEEAPSLGYVNLTGNPVADWSPAASWTGVWVERG